MEKILSPRGTRDIYFNQAFAWQYLSAKAREIFGKFGYSEIMTPSFESTKLFKRGIGESTDIVQKEMYTFRDKRGRDLTLRPEGTASIVRAFIQHGLSNLPQPVKLLYVGQMFRYERPQAGRYREFTQIGIEALGSDDPLIDAESIIMLDKYLRAVGLKNFDTLVNTMGCADDRHEFTKKLAEYIRKDIKLCKDCIKRAELNPLRVFDCKEKSCQDFLEGAPKITDNVCENCASHFALVLRFLDDVGLAYTLDKKLVRGFDYYTRTAFEMRVKELGAQDAVAGGGRYDNLVERFGGPPTPAIGFAIGLDRLYIAISEKPRQEPITLYIAKLSEEQKPEVLKLATLMRSNNITCELDYMNRSLKAQLKQASKAGVRYLVVIGPDEIKTGKCKLKEMETGKEKETTINGLLGELVDKDK